MAVQCTSLHWNYFEPTQKPNGSRAGSLVQNVYVLQAKSKLHHNVILTGVFRRKADEVALERNISTGTALAAVT